MTPAALVRRLSPAQLVLVSFAGAVFTGTAVLSLPGMEAPGTPPVALLDAFFTATSAVCITGLTTVDTASRWSPLGQAAILLFMQLGGLGIMTCSTLLVLLLRGRFSVRGRRTLQDTVGGASAPDLRRLMRIVIGATLVAESVGTVALTARFALDMPLGQAAWFGVFHAVAAFNQAGFALFPDSLVRYVGDPVVNVVVSGLIIVGGLGFLVIGEFWQRRGAGPVAKALSLHTKVVLATSGVLLLVGMTGFALLEWRHALSGLSWPEALLASWFQAVTPRSAGLSTVDYARLSNPTLLFTIVLMFIGAAPGSTGGGVKVTAAAVVWGLARSQFAGEERVHVFRRAVPHEAVARSVTIAAAAAAAVTLLTLVLQITEAHGPVSDARRGLFLALLFEAVSALGTVGLSLGVTPELSAPGKVLVALAMYIGRVGPLTLTLGLSRATRGRYEYSEAPVVVG